MDARERDLIANLVLDRMTVEQFVEATGVDPRAHRSFVSDRLRDAIARHAADDVDWLVSLAFKFDLDADWAPIFCDLLDADWHRAHENAASALQDIRDPVAVPFLLRAAQKRLDYLDYDEAYALAIKCIWALHDIGTDDAANALKTLAESEIAIIRDGAEERLRDLAARRADDPFPAYRLARDARVRR